MDKLNAIKATAIITAVSLIGMTVYNRYNKKNE
jgi:hypothetical protein